MSERDVDVIRIRVASPQHLFHSVDPSPFIERDLDPICAEFIVSWARELARDHEFRLEIDITSGRRDDPMVAEIPTAVHSHFEREADMQQLRVRRVLREGRTSLALGIGILALCTMASALISAANLGAVGSFVGESLGIAGWVAMWHPVHTLLYGYWPVIRERRLYERLARAEVELAFPLGGPQPVSVTPLGGTQPADPAGPPAVSAGPATSHQSAGR